MPRAALREELLLAFEPEWFKRMSDKEQKEYLAAHPGSKLGHSPHSTQTHLSPSSQPMRHAAHPVDHPVVQSALQPNSDERRQLSRKVSKLGERVVEFYRHLPHKDRADAGALAQKFAKNKPMAPHEVGRLASFLNNYQAWAKGLDEQKLGYGVLKGAGAAGALGLAASPVGQVGLALGSILLAGYAVKKGYPYALRAMKSMRQWTRNGAPRSRPSASPARTRSPAPARPQVPALPAPPEVIPPSNGPRRGDHLAALAAYFHGALWTNTTKGDNAGYDPENLDSDGPGKEAFGALFTRLAAIVKDAHLTPEQWKPLLAYTKRRF